MHLAPVTSSQLLRAGYNEDTQTFVVQFADNSAIYAYLNVDPMLADRFEEAESKGSFFIKEIRGKRGEPLHEYRKLGDASLLDADGNIRDEALDIVLKVFPARTKDDLPKPQGKPLPPAPDIHGTRSEKPQPTGEVIAPGKVDTIPALPEDNAELPAVALSVQGRAQAMSISSGSDYAAVEAFLLTIKSTFNMVRARLQKVVDPAYEAYVAARTLRDEATNPYQEAERILKGKMLAYNRQEEERRRAEERRLTAERMDQAKRDAEEASRQEAEQTAQMHEAQGELELAQSARANPLPMVPAPVAPVVLEREVPKGKSSVREKWKYRNAVETNLITHAFPDATVGQIRMLLGFFSLDDSKCNSYAKTMKLAGTIPGAIEIYDEGSISARTK